MDTPNTPYHADLLAIGQLDISEGRGYGTFRLIEGGLEFHILWTVTVQ